MSRILIVDDSFTIREDLRCLLSRHNHEVFEAANGHEGLELCKNEARFDLIISDYNMPVLDGIEMIKRIGDIKEQAAVPCLMLTTETSDELRKLGKAAGVLAWVVKPYNPQAMISAVDKLCSKS